MLYIVLYFFVRIKIFIIFLKYYIYNNRFIENGFFGIIICNILEYLRIWFYYKI